MAMKAGDTAQQTCDVRCIDCNGTIHVTKGKEVPMCSCGGDTFESHSQSQSSSKSKPHAKRKSA